METRRCRSTQRRREQRTQHYSGFTISTPPGVDRLYTWTRPHDSSAISNLARTARFAGNRYAGHLGGEQCGDAHDWGKPADRMRFRPGPTSIGGCCEKIRRFGRSLAGFSGGWRCPANSELRRNGSNTRDGGVEGDSPKQLHLIDCVSSN